MSRIFQLIILWLLVLLLPVILAVIGFLFGFVVWVALVKLGLALWEVKRREKGDKK